MVTVRQITKRKDYKKFVKFPTNLYKDNPYYVPPMEMDEFKMTTKKNAHYDECDQAYFLAEEGGKVVGRIACIVLHPFNTKNNAKYARFTRFDVIDSEEVAHLLLKTAEDWAKNQGMEYIHGPLGYDDLEREGLMTFGFDKKSSFISNYNHPYYQTYIESYGYVPDAKWVEWRIKLPIAKNERIERVADMVERRYGFHEKEFKNMNDLIKKHGDDFFDLIDETFEDLYGTIPFTEKLRKQVISTFKLILDKRYVCLVFNKEEKLIGFGLSWPSFADAMIKSRGRALPFGFIHWLKALKKPNAVDLGIQAVRKEYRKFGVTGFIIHKLQERFSKIPTLEYADTALQLEDNDGALRSLEMFERELIRKKTCYIKKLSNEEPNNN